MDVLRGQCLMCCSEADFVQRMPKATIAILATRVLDPYLKLLLSLERTCPSVPLMVITTFDSQNVRMLADVRLSSVVWTIDSGDHLSAEIARIRKLSRRIPPALLHALRLIEFGPTIRTVEELSRAVHCDATTLRRQWRTQCSAGGLKELVDWGLLSRACSLSEKGDSPLRAAHVLGIDQTTLARLSKRLTAHSAGELWQTPGIASIRFRAWLTAVDLRDPGPEWQGMVDSVSDVPDSA